MLPVAAVADIVSGICFQSLFAKILLGHGGKKPNDVDPRCV